MKPVHLQSLLDAYEDLSSVSFEQYLQQFSMDMIRDGELNDLKQLLQQLNHVQHIPLHHFFVGYRIKQISKEFDLLRIGRNYIINIELKRESSLERVKRQLLQNIYYLKFLEVDIYSFTYISSTNTLYKLDGENLFPVSPNELITALTNQEVRELSSIDDLFDPINYLLSPFEEPHAFMKGEYFLTAPQTTFKREIVDLVENNHNVVIDGAPGTGKTLLTYDLVKHWLKKGKKVTLIHGKTLSNAQHILAEEYGWHIQTSDQISIENSDIVVIDEAQILTHIQLQKIRIQLEKHQLPAVFSLDAGFYLFGTGKRIDVLNYLEKYFSPKVYELKMVMRYNKEMYTFAQQLLDQKKQLQHAYFPNVSVNYFSTWQAAQSFFIEAYRTNWLIVNCFEFERFIMRDILSEEVNRVCVVIDERFSYKANGRLSVSRGNAMIDPMQVLYHTIVRTRRKLQLVVIGNIPLLQYVLHMLNRK